MKRNLLSSRRPLFSRPLRMECLEERALLAGNVNVSVTGGVLRIRGDQLGNGVIISQEPNGSYTITSDGATTINGGAGPITRSAQSIDIDMGNGSDAIGITNNDAALVDLANGVNPNAVAADLVNIPGFLNIRTGTDGGADQVGLLVNVQFSAVITTFRGGDAVGVAGSSFGGSLIINVDGGDNAIDGVAIFESSVFGAVSILTGNGADAVLIDMLQAQSLVINTGSGGDSLQLDNSNIGTSLVISTGGSRDLVAITNVNVGVVANLNFGDGNDGVVIDDLDVGQTLLIQLGSGNDTLDLSNSSAANALLYGGLGTDTSTQTANTFGRRTRLQFEP